MTRIHLFLFAALSLIFVSGSAAQPGRVPLELTMNYNEVIRAWGQPDSKQQMEISRRDVWYYGEYKVVFKEGKVLAWIGDDKGSARSYQPRPTKREVPQPPAATPEKEAEDPAVEEILQDLIGG